MSCTYCPPQQRRVRRAFDRERQVTLVPGESVTDTQFGNDTDINRIIARFKRDGVTIQPPEAQPYGDVSGLQEDLDVILQRGRDAADELEKLQEQARSAQEAQNRADQEELAKLRAQAAQPATEETDP